MVKRSQSPDLLVKSKPDDAALCKAVEEKFLELIGLYSKIKGVELIPPVELNKAMHLWRRMAVRHKSGDFRHSRSETMALREIAEWTLRENTVLRNQEEVPKVEWRD